MLDVLDAGDGSESKCRTIGNGCVHLNLSIERQHGAGATVEQRIVLQNLDSSLHSLPDSGNDSFFFAVGYCSDTTMNDDRVHWSSTLNMITYLASIWYTQ